MNGNQTALKLFIFIKDLNPCFYQRRGKNRSNVLFHFFLLKVRVS